MEIFMNSLRMCAACREMKKKAELLRIVKIKGEKAKIDLSFKAQGRGAYLCKNRECIKRAEKSRALERAFRGAVEPSLYESLGEMIDE